MVLLARGAYYPLCSCRGPVLAELGHPDVAAEDICTSACISIRGTLRSRRGCGRCAGFRVRPVPSELGRGRLSRFSLLSGGWVFCVWGGEGCRGLACCVVAWRFACRHTKARHRHTTAAGNHFKKSQGYRTGQIRVTNSRKSSTSLPCSNRPTPKRVATSALSSNDK